jgi:APA family basic amino acid/polyamine antiporter
MPGFPIPPLLYLASSSLILVLAFLERPVESTVALVMVAAGIPVYLVFARRNRRLSSGDRAES